MAAIRGADGKFIGGVASVIAKMKRLPEATRVGMMQSFEDQILKVHATAVQSIQEHQSAGAIYKRGNVEHQASEPGYAPNSDTGTLAQSIHFEIDSANLSARVGSGLAYARYLEQGTTNIAARPWLMPAWEQNKPDVSSIIKAIQQAFKAVQSA